MQRVCGVRVWVAQVLEHIMVLLHTTCNADSDGLQAVVGFLLVAR